MKKNKPSIRLKILNLIAAEVAEKFGVKVADLKGKSRPEEIVIPRMVVYYIASQTQVFLPTTATGKFLNRTHTAVSHGALKLKDKMDTEPKFAELVKGLLAVCGDKINALDMA